MTSSLPNFLTNPAILPVGSPVIPVAALISAGTAPAPAAGAFDDLLMSPVAGIQPVAEQISPAVVPNILSRCVPAAVEPGTETISGEAAMDLPADTPAPLSRDTIEAAVAFAAGVLQAAMPGLAVSAPREDARPCVPPTTAAIISEPTRRDAVAPAVAAQPGEIFSPAVAAPRELCPPPENPTNPEGLVPDEPRWKNEVAQPAPRPTEFQIAGAADGAIEIKLALPVAGKPATEYPGTATTPFEVQAELELPGQAVMRLQANGSFSHGDPARPGRANFAAKNHPANPGGESRQAAGEINFVSTADERVKTRSSEAGIPVAKMPANMPTATFDPARVSGDAAAVGTPAPDGFRVNSSAAGPTPGPMAAVNQDDFAQRAVATVANLVDAQFSASMQKSGSVQVRLKFGGEDLSIRVEMRGGVVHTFFRTDSAELRAALTREMQAVATQSPDQVGRYLAPVFSPASPSSLASSSGDADPQPGRHQGAQQDFTQPRPPRDLPGEAAPFARRSLLRDSFFPEPVAPRAPVLLPTSLRLSALA